MTDFELLSRPSPEFSALTFRGLSRHLAEPNDSYFGIGARVNELPVGLALGWRPGPGKAILLSVAVSPTRRRRGIGRGLVAHWEREAMRRGASRVSAHFGEDLLCRDALAGLLTTSGWHSPTETLFRVIGYAGQMGRQVDSLPGMARRLLSSGSFSYEDFRFRPEDEGAIERLVAQPDASDFPDPRSFRDRFIPETSVAIRKNGVLVGWVIGVPPASIPAIGRNRADVACVEYAVNYLDPALAHTGASIPAFTRAYRAQARLFGEDSLAIYFTHPGRPRMVAMTRRRFGPIALRMDTIFSSRKSFEASPPHEQPTLKQRSDGDAG